MNTQILAALARAHVDELLAGAARRRRRPPDDRDPRRSLRASAARALYALGDAAFVLGDGVAPRGGCRGRCVAEHVEA